MYGTDILVKEATKHRIELASPYKRRIHSASYRATPQAREFLNNKNDKMLATDVIEPQTEWESSIAFVSKNKEQSSTVRLIASLGQ